MNGPEFYMVIKVMHRRPGREIWKLFDEYSEVGLDEAAPENRNISLGNFI